MLGEIMAEISRGVALLRADRFTELVRVIPLHDDVDIGRQQADEVMPAARKV